MAHGADLRRILTTLVLAGCSFTLNGERLWGQARIDRFVASLTEEQCRLTDGCADGDVEICAARRRAFAGDTSRCRFSGGLADTCLAELGSMTCDEPFSMPPVCFEVLGRCDVFFFQEDTGFDRMDTAP